MAARGVEFRLNARLADAKPGIVVLDDGEIPSETLVWTAGTAPSPIIKFLDVEKDKRGAVKVSSDLQSQAIPECGPWEIALR